MWNLKNKTNNRYREQTSGYQWGKRSGEWQDREGNYEVKNC